MRNALTRLGYAWDNWVASVQHNFQYWAYWKLTGWPFKRRCPGCAGSKTNSSEVMARYGDTPHVCDMCQGTGRVAR